jgi:hypothetical protein
MITVSKKWRDETLTAREKKYLLKFSFWWHQQCVKEAHVNLKVIISGAICGLWQRERKRDRDKEREKKTERERERERERPREKEREREIVKVKVRIVLFCWEMDKCDR